MDDFYFDLTIYGILFGSLLLCVLMIFWAVYRRRKEQRKEINFIETCKRIRPGMSKQEILTILGHNYSPSYLQNNIEKLEWTYQKGGYGHVVDGTGSYCALVVRSISVHFQNDIAVEVYTNNLG